MIDSNTTLTAGPMVSREIRQSDDFDNIYNRYWKRIYGLAYHRLHSSHIAENIVQDVFTSLWMRQANQANAPVRDVYAWLSAATKYAIIRQIAGQQKLQTESLDSELVIATSDTTDFLFIERMLASEINRLPRKCKLVFLYSREHNLPNRMVAQKLNLSEKTVEKHITTAIRQLRVRLKDFFS